MFSIKTLKLLGLAALAFPALALAGTTHFAGTWQLDKAQSKNLSPQRQGTASHKIAITQDAATLHVGIDIDPGRPEIPPIKMTHSYQLDGSVVNTETEIITPNGPLKIPTTFQATPQADGSLDITIVRTLPARGGGEPRKLTMQEHWTLSPDGKAINIHLKEDLPRGGSHESDLVFVKQD